MSQDDKPVIPTPTELNAEQAQAVWAGFPSAGLSDATDRAGPTPGLWLPPLGGCGEMGA